MSKKTLKAVVVFSAENRRKLHETQQKTAEVLNSVLTELYVADAKGVSLHPQTYAYQLARAQMGDNPSSMAVATANVAYQALQNYRKKLRKGESCTLPTFRRRAPVPIRPDGWSLTRTDDLWTVRLKIDSEKGVWVEGKIFFSGWRALEQAPLLLSQKKAAIKLKWNARKEKWLLLFVLDVPDAEKLEGEVVVAVHRGMRSFLFAACSNGDQDHVFCGDDIIALKAKMRARRAALGRHLPEMGDGGHGHGVRRRFAAMTRLGDKEERFIDTKCKQAAAKVVKYAVAKGASTILLEGWVDKSDWWMVRQWPWVKLADSIKWAAKGNGVEVVEAAGVGCPTCGPKAELLRSKERSMCLGCGLELPDDAMRCRSMLLENGVETGLKVSLERRASHVD